MLGWEVTNAATNTMQQMVAAFVLLHYIIYTYMQGLTKLSDILLSPFEGYFLVLRPRRMMICHFPL